DYHGWYEVGAELFRRAADMLIGNTEDETEERLRLWAWSRTQQASFLIPLARYEEASDLLQSSLNVLRTVSPGEEILFAPDRLGIVAHRRNFDRSIPNLHQEALTLATQIGFTRGIVFTSIDLSLGTMLNGRYAEALPLAQKALALCREMNHAFGESIMLRCL